RHADIATDAISTATLVVTGFSKLSLGDISIEEVWGVLDAKVKAVQPNDLRDADALLTAQAVGLNSIYTACVTVAQQNLVEHLDVGATEAAGASDPALAAVGTVHRPADD